jgi:integrase
MAGKYQYKRKKVLDEHGIYVDVYGKDDAELAAKVEAKKQEIELAKRLAANPLVFNYAKTWYTKNVGAKDLSDSRKANIASAINNYICPAIGTLHVAEVTEDDIALVMDLLDGKSRSLQEKVVQTLTRMFASAEKEKLIDENPCEDLKAGGKEPDEKDALLPAQKEALLEAVQGEAAEGIVRTGLFAGLRREEIFGLRWDCVVLNKDAPYIMVRRACRWKHNKPIVTEKLKSKKARRDIPIPPQLSDWLAAEKAKGGSDYVLHMEDGQPFTQTAFKNSWAYITRRQTGMAKRGRKGPDGKPTPVLVEKKLGDKVPNSNVTITLDFPVTPHILRHTYITDLILGGVNIKVVQYLAGHEKVETTLNIYAHLMVKRPEANIGAVLSAFQTPEIKKDPADPPPQN